MPLEKILVGDKHLAEENDFHKEPTLNIKLFLEKRSEDVRLRASKREG